MSVVLKGGVGGGSWPASISATAAREIPAKTVESSGRHGLAQGNATMSAILGFMALKFCCIS